MYMHKKVVLGYVYLIAKLLYMLASCTCVVVVDVVVDGVVIGFEDNIVVDTVFYRECIEGYMLIRTKETLDTDITTTNN